jgi:hypothetical protein
MITPLTAETLIWTIGTQAKYLPRSEGHQARDQSIWLWPGEDNGLLRWEAQPCTGRTLDPGPGPPESFCVAKKQWGEQRRSICASCTPSGLTVGYVKDSRTRNGIWINISVKVPSRHFSNDYKWPMCIWKKCSTSLTKEMHVKTTTRHRLTLVSQ